VGPALVEKASGAVHVKVGDLASVEWGIRGPGLPPQDGQAARGPDP